jgi:hypothetical protein
MTIHFTVLLLLNHLTSCVPLITSVNISAVLFGANRQTLPAVWTLVILELSTFILIPTVSP